MCDPRASDDTASCGGVSCFAGSSATGDCAGAEVAVVVEAIADETTVGCSLAR